MIVFAISISVSIALTVSFALLTSAVMFCRVWAINKLLIVVALITCCLIFFIALISAVSYAVCRWNIFLSP